MPVHNDECGRLEGIISLRILARNYATPRSGPGECVQHTLAVVRFSSELLGLFPYTSYMKSCGVSLPAAAASARSLGAAANDEEKMATEIEEDFPKLTAQEKQSLAAADRFDSILYDFSTPDLFFIYFIY